LRANGSSHVLRRASYHERTKAGDGRGADGADRAVGDAGAVRKPAQTAFAPGQEPRLRSGGFSRACFHHFFPRWFFAEQSEIDSFFETEMPGPETVGLFEEAKRLGIAFCIG
jgi:hypothetical protein